MNKLRDIICYVCLKNPYKDDLSNARLNKIIYLADWRNILIRNRQVSNIKWIFNHYGPYVHDIINEVSNNDDIFRIKIESSEYNNFGITKQIILLRNPENYKELKVEDADSIDFIIERTKEMPFKDFINYVYSTYPVLTSEHGDTLDLIKKAKDYRINKDSIEKSYNS